jgi:two-component system OmpR family response regulator
LGEQGFVVDNFSNGADGLEAALSRNYDLVILDVMMPEMNGWDVLARLRETDQRIPVLMLTANAAIHQRVKGLNLGADEYVTKPFIFSELNARVNALGRRAPMREQTASVLKLVALELNRLQRSARVGDKTLDLKPKEFQLLEYLMQNADRVVTRTMLLEHVWDFHFDPKTTIVETHISRIRAKLEACGPGAPTIHTVRGAGYMLDAN